ncbi:MAG: flagellar hook protein FlgE [Rhizobiaceae bacterium]|nr:flagellar hook protein FlgE [Rhizobiaceae bacterium]
MSLYGMMRTGVSGMAAQANRLSSVADNIANSGTTGYKRSRAEFSSMVLPSTQGAYNSGGVTTTIMNSVSAQGVLQYTTSVTDLAVSGNGFFIVQDSSGTPFLTRAGAFVPDAQGRLVNAAGYQLMGYSYDSGVPAATANGFAGLVPVTITQEELTASPTTQGTFSANLPADAAPVTDLPSANAATATYSAKSSMVAYDNLGSEVLLDVYFSKTANPNEWEVTIYPQAGATPGVGFPYTPAAPLVTTNLTFDPVTGGLDTVLPSPTSLTLNIPNGAAMTLDVSKLTQLATDYTPFAAKVDGNPPSGIEQVEIGADGTVYAQYENGSIKELYRIPLATVESPDRLTVISGNVFRESPDSGSVQVGFAGEGEMGTVVSGALENSNVDIAEELTNMIESQRTYTANSKVFQTGADLMDILVNLKR